MDYLQLNSVVVHDAFPILRTDVAPQAVYYCQQFSSIDLAQGYLQLAMDATAFYNVALCAALWVYWFALSSIKLWIKLLQINVLYNQLLVVVLLYLNGVCVFAKSIDEMLGWVNTVWIQLREFNLNLQPEKCCYLWESIVFLGYGLSSDGILADPDKVEKC